MKEIMQRAKKLLNSLENTSLVVINCGKIYTSDKKGIKPVLELTERLKNATVADKVIGGAAAFLFVRGCVSDVYGEIMSEKAAWVLNRAGISYSYGTLVPYIKNRTGDGMCPLERLCLGLDTPTEAYDAITLFFQ